MHCGNCILDLVNMLISRGNDKLLKLSNEMSIRLKRYERMNAISKSEQRPHIVTAIGPQVYIVITTTVQEESMHMNIN